jgi:hypothetical protein
MFSCIKFIVTGVGVSLTALIYFTYQNQSLKEKVEVTQIKSFERCQEILMDNLNKEMSEIKDSEEVNYSIGVHRGVI